MKKKTVKIGIFKISNSAINEFLHSKKRTKIKLLVFENENSPSEHVSEVCECKLANRRKGRKKRRTLLAVWCIRLIFICELSTQFINRRDIEK